MSSTNHCQGCHQVSIPFDYLEECTSVFFLRHQVRKNQILEIFTGPQYSLKSIATWTIQLRKTHAMYATHTTNKWIQQSNKQCTWSFQNMWQYQMTKKQIANVYSLLKPVLQQNHTFHYTMRHTIEQYIAIHITLHGRTPFLLPIVSVSKCFLLLKYIFSLLCLGYR